MCKRSSNHGTGSELSLGVMLMNKHAVSLEGKVVYLFKAYCFLDAPIVVTFNKADSWQNTESHSWNHI